MIKLRHFNGPKSLWLGVLFVLGLLVVSLGNCKHEPILENLHINTPLDTSGHVQEEDTNICFERDILPIIQTNCAKPNQPGDGCHDANSAAEGLVLTNYNNIRKAGIVPGNPSASKFFVQLNTGKMSLAKYGNLSSDQKALIKRWILEGAKDGTNCPSKCDTTVFTYSKAIQPIINTYCVGCHKPGSLSGNTDLSSYTGVSTAANNGKLLSSLLRTSSWMPLGGNKLSDCKITQIKKWIKAGAQNN